MFGIFKGRDKKKDQGTKAERARIPIEVKGRVRWENVAIVPGEVIEWCAAWRMNFGDSEKMELAREVAVEHRELEENSRLFVPPEVIDGVVRGAVTLAEGVELVESEKEEERCEVLKVEEVKAIEQVQEELHSSVEENGVGDVADGLGVEKDASVAGEVEASSGSQSEDREGKDGEEVEITGLEKIRQTASRKEMTAETKCDESLSHWRKWADDNTMGFRWSEGLLMRTRLNEWGEASDQLCIPKPYRKKCIILAHDAFGHRGKKRVYQDLAKFFAWPNMSSDVANHCRACYACQTHDKTKPRPNPMKEREICSQPFDKVCIDVVGPFPQAKGGFRFLLTLVDEATRWPEAVPLRTVTAQIVTTQLKKIFASNGFPKVLVSDNGPQFRGKVFKRFMNQFGIEHVCTTPYHPQGNGVILFYE